MFLNAAAMLGGSLSSRSRIWRVSAFSMCNTLCTNAPYFKLNISCCNQGDSAQAPRQTPMSEMGFFTNYQLNGSAVTPCERYSHWEERKSSGSSGTEGETWS